MDEDGKKEEEEEEEEEEGALNTFCQKKEEGEERPSQSSLSEQESVCGWLGLAGGDGKNTSSDF